MTGICVEVDYSETLGLLSVKHDGTITWDDLQALKDEYFGKEAVAIEVYPPENRVVNNGNWRHLWLLGETDWWPDLLGESVGPDNLPLKYRVSVAGINGNGDA